MLGASAGDRKAPREACAAGGAGAHLALRGRVFKLRRPLPDISATEARSPSTTFAAGGPSWGSCGRF